MQHQALDAQHQALDAGRGRNGSPVLRIRLYGCFALTGLDGRPATPRCRKSRAILAYLAAHSGSQVTRERLMDLLWGDRSEPQARSSLRQALSEIRRSAPDLIVADREHAWIRPESLLVEPGTESADLFEDLNHITPEFDDWLTAERARRGARDWQKLESQAEKLLAKGKGGEALPLIERMSEIDPYNEEWLRLAMRAEYQESHPAGIELRYKGLAERLDAELGLQPSVESKKLHDSLLDRLRSDKGGADRAGGNGTAEPPAQPGTGEAAAEPGRPPGPPAKQWQRPAAKRWQRPVAALIGAAAFAGALGLSQSATSTAGPGPKVAVLPFSASAGADPSLAEGLSDELLSQLTRMDGLRVIGRTSAAQYRGGAADLRVAGKDLGAHYLVEGKVSGSPDQARIHVSLVRVRDGSAVWARSFGGDLENLQPIPAAIGGAVARSLGAEGGPIPVRAANPQAYALYVRAKSLIRSREARSLDTAIELLRQAVRIDPQFAAAWAQLGGAARLSGEARIMLDAGARTARVVTIHDAVRHALRLDPDLAEAHAMMSLVEPYASPRARFHLRRAIQLDPGDSQTLYWKSGILQAQGDFDSARAELEKVASLDPFWVLPVTGAVQARIEAGDEAGAKRLLEALAKGNPAAAADVAIAAAAASGDYSRAVELALSRNRAAEGFGSATASSVLRALDFHGEAMLLSRARMTDRRWNAATEPLPEIVRQLRDKAASGQVDWFYSTLWQLAEAGRWRDIAALYDDGPGPIGQLRSDDVGARYFRVSLGPLVAVALHLSGRGREAVRLAQRSAADSRHMLGNRFIPPATLVDIAAIDAILGRKAAALDLLERALAEGWRLDPDSQMSLRANPLFATLRGDPRFERLAQVQDAHLAKEKREIRRLGLF